MPRSQSPVVGNLIQLGNIPGGGGGSAPVVAAGSLQVSLTNGDAAPHALGDLVYLSGNSTVRKAIPNGTAAQAAVYAMALGTVAPAAVAFYLLFGQVSGLAGGVFNTLGFLGAGSIITTVVPSAPGTFSTLVGLWQSAAIFNFEPQVPLAI